MIAWIVANWANIVVLAVVLLLVILALRSILPRKGKSAGCAGCGAGCSCCSGGCAGCVYNAKTVKREKKKA
ncbi:MAG: FeoB-associated Cys-rich membrane protein [Firmicutes bacterium]|nr:FeoB-associated Cys-rich membrane protein [Bacillota bacterium]